MDQSSTSLGDALAELLDETSDVEVLATREYARGGVAFAARTGEDVIELRLGADVADAARRTRDTVASARGKDWVHFAPRQWNEHATDRLNAWFRVAWRRAGAK